MMDGLCVKASDSFVLFIGYFSLQGLALPGQGLVGSSKELYSPTKRGISNCQCLGSAFVKVTL
jgi:hypothetical protein